MVEHNPEYRYWAFISYSSKDSAVAARLHRKLETYRIPRDLVGRPGRGEAVPGRLFPIFRDREELPLSADLGASIEDALRASRYLIVLCSPGAAASRWVNEEIRYFKELGREDRILAVILDGEPNASDAPSTADRECFPTALRYRVDSDGQLTTERVEPIGGDLRPKGDGWSGVFLKAVAGVTGLGLDAFARRERKRQRRRQLLASGAALVALVAGLWGWDYNRVKVAHYANVASVWGVPEGVGRLDARMRSGREVHYRFETRRYQVRQVLRVNSAAQLRNDDENHGASVQQLFYREDGSVRQIDLRDHNGRLLMRQGVSELRDTANGRVHVITFHSELGGAVAMDAAIGALEIGVELDRDQRTDITAQEVLHDQHGRPIRVTYRNAYGANRANAEGVFGQRFEYEDDALLPSRTENLGFDGQPQLSRGGIVSLAVDRNAHGDRSAEAYFGVDGEPATHRNGYHYVLRELTAYGNNTSAAFFGPAGQPVLHRNGYHRLTQAYDERGNQIEQANFGVDGEPVLHRNGHHRLTYAFDERGNWIEQAYFGVVGEPVLNRNGYHRLTNAYDERGNLIEWATFGVDGEPVLHRNGYHRLTNAYDERGNWIEQAYFGVVGEPVLNRNGYHRVTNAYDERGNQIEWTYFGVDGEPVLHRDGYHRKTNAFDERGKRIESALFGMGGEPVLHRDGYHRLTQAYDERGNLIEQAYFGLDGESASVGGFVRLEAEWDALGNQIGLIGHRADGTSEILE